MEKMNEHVWTPSGTDITIRWRQMGWVPPSEQQSYRNKWKYYQELPMRYLSQKDREMYEANLQRNKVTRVK